MQNSEVNQEQGSTHANNAKLTKKSKIYRDKWDKGDNQLKVQGSMFSQLRISNLKLQTLFFPSLSSPSSLLNLWFPSRLWCSFVSCGEGATGGQDLSCFGIWNRYER
jgi:hypothetical protein